MKKSKITKDVFLVSLGCPRNLVDSEVLVGSLKKKGFKVVYEFKKDAIAIVNTCGFIESAKQESIDVILELADLKRKGKLKLLVVCGCLSQRYSKSLMKEIEEIDAIFGSSTFSEIPSRIDEILKGEKLVLVDKRPEFLYHDKMPRATLTSKHSIYVKIQEGCMNFCSYCVIPKIRGPFRSREKSSILKEIDSFKKSGSKEINIIGQDTTLYGKDKSKISLLPDLLKEASRIMDKGWVRLLYTHPAHYSQELIDTVKNEASVCKYLDLPIQHINDKMLKKMNRHVSKKEIVSLIEKLRQEIPNLAIRTSIIVGFPGETEKIFKELMDFVKSTKFERLGVFKYSREEETKAYDFPNQVPEKEKDKRFTRLMEAQRSISEEINKNYLGKTLKVLIDERDLSDPDHFIGRSQHDAPEVDGSVYVKSKRRLKTGDFVSVKIDGTLEYDLLGSEVT